MSENKDKLDAKTISDNELETVSGGDRVIVSQKGITVTLEYSCPKCGCKDLRGITDGETFYKDTDLYKKITDAKVTCRNCGYIAKGGQFNIKTISKE